MNSIGTLTLAPRLTASIIRAVYLFVCLFVWNVHLYKLAAPFEYESENIF